MFSVLVPKIFSKLVAFAPVTVSVPVGSVTVLWKISSPLCAMIEEVATLPKLI